MFHQDNQIQKIEGLDYCQRLKNLDLSNNCIAKIEGLNNLPLIHLSLVRDDIELILYKQQIKLNVFFCVTIKAANKIRKIEGLNSLRFLRTLDLSCNNLRSLSGIPEKHEFLEKLFLEDNKVWNF